MVFWLVYAALQMAHIRFVVSHSTRVTFFWFILFFGVM
jgi:hypothetical protein